MHVSCNKPLKCWFSRLPKVCLRQVFPLARSISFITWRVNFNCASVPHIPMVHAHDVSKQIPREKKFPSVTPRATLTHLSCSPNFPRTSYLDERTLTYEPIVKYTSAMCEETLLAQSRQNRLKSVSTRAPGSRASCHLTDFNETLPV